MVIRHATDGDAPRVAAILEAANAEYASVLPPALFANYIANVVDIDRRRRECSELLVAEHDGEVVGSVTFYPDASEEGFGLPSEWAGFRALAVDPSARGLGIGRALVRACIDRARELGAPTLALHTASFMTSAVPLYEAAGFRRCAEHDAVASLLFEADPAGGDVLAIAYRLDL